MVNQVQAAQNIQKVIQSLNALTTMADQASQKTSNMGVFADMVFKNPAKKVLESTKNAEKTALLSTTGAVDELTLASYVNEAEMALQEFKVLWEKSLSLLNELPRISM